MTKQRTSFPYWKRCSLFSISEKENIQKGIICYFIFEIRRTSSGALNPPLEKIFTIYLSQSYRRAADLKLKIIV